MKVLLGDGRVFGKLKLLLETAVRSLQILLPDLELKVRATTFARKDSSFAIINLLAGFFFGHEACHSTGTTVDKEKSPLPPEA
ncbi:MAG: hypothetical protein ACKVHE_08225 [Planctomycetales bacterium]